MIKKEVNTKSTNKTIFWVIFSLLLFGLAIFTLFYYVGFGAKMFGNVALIHIDGMITSSGASDTFSEGGVSSRDVLSFIQDADSDKAVKAILFEINSPGGTVYASKEIVDAVKNSKKYTVCVIKDVGASGAYWVASACDEIIAGDLSIVGSIGVIGSYLEFSGLLQKYNVTYQRLVSTKYKDSGSPYKPLSIDEREVFQNEIDKIHNYFVLDVARNRNISKEKVEGLATGEVYLGLDAVNLGLIDQIGDRKTAEAVIKNKFKLEKIEIIEYSSKKTIFDLFSSAFSMQSFAVGRGIGREITKASVDSNFVIRT